MRLLISICMLMITSTVFASSATSSSSHEVLLGEMNDQSAGASQYQPKIESAPRFIQEQNAITNTYEQEQVQIEEEEDYYTNPGFGMYGGPFFY